jgi:hypothetical protein
VYFWHKCGLIETLKDLGIGTLVPPYTDASGSYLLGAGVSGRDSFAETWVTKSGRFA